jgi:octaprenyl-diphosphate synthase
MQSPANTDASRGPVPSRVPAFRLVRDELGQVRKLVNERLAVGADKSEIGRLLGTLSIDSGKMLRPGLVLLAGASCGKITDKHIQVGAIVEIIHNATLLHDDVLDEGQKRRGKPTVNSLLGNETAVLLGDFLLSKVVEMCVDLEPEVTRVIAATTVRICEGELRQAIQRGNWQLSEPDYIDIITEKSAALFGCCCELGGLMAGASEEQAKLLSDFGLNCGIAFQITDDLLDIVGSETVTGKTLRSDVGEGKLTLAIIHLLRAVGESERSAVKGRLVSSAGHKRALQELLQSHGSLEYTRGRAQEFVTKAIAALAELKESSAKEALKETAKYAAARAA